MNSKSKPSGATAALILEDGTVFWGYGIGSETESVGEICFNTSITGYQEILTDPSYAGQIITFTFPHIGNVGTNEEDIETHRPVARGLILRQPITEPSNWRASKHLDEWLKEHNIPGITGIDTRALTRHIRDEGAPKGMVVHRASGNIEPDQCLKKINQWPGLEGLDLAKDVTCARPYGWDEKTWQFGEGYTKQSSPQHHVVAIDYGAKQNILRCLASVGCKVTVVPATTTADKILKLNPDGIFLSNGPGDPAETGKYAIPIIQDLLQSGKPIFGICLGHQLLSLALGAKTRKMHLGHRGANHPVKDLSTGTVEITSQNHGFEVIAESLPDHVKTTHISLFDGSNEGIALTGKPVFSVQYHPEASPGPQDSHYLFERFVSHIKAAA